MIEKLKPLGKKLSPLGKLLPLTDLIGINKDNAGEKIGSVGGRMLGTFGGEGLPEWRSEDWLEDLRVQ